MNNKQLIPTNHLKNNFRKVFLRHSKIAVNNFHLMNIYELNNSAGMMILGGCIEFENIYKDLLFEIISNKFTITEFKQTIITYSKKPNIDLKRFNKKMEKIKNKNDLFKLISSSMFGQLRTVTRALDIWKDVGKKLNHPTGVRKLLKNINLWRNEIGHGGSLKYKIIDECEKEWKLSSLLSYLFKYIPKLKHSLNNLLSDYNSKTIGFDISFIISDLKCQGLLDFTNWSKIIDKEEFMNFFIGNWYKELKKEDKKR